MIVASEFRIPCFGLAALFVIFGTHAGDDVGGKEAIDQAIVKGDPVFIGGASCAREHPRHGYREPVLFQAHIL